MKPGLAARNVAGRRRRPACRAGTWAGRRGRGWPACCAGGGRPSCRPGPRRRARPARGGACPSRRWRTTSPNLLEAITQRLEGRDDGGAFGKGTAEEHAETRRSQGYDLRQVVDEYALLRQVVLREAGAAGALGDEAGLRTFSWSIDQAVVEAVDAFIAGRDSTQAALDRIASAALESRDRRELLPRLLEALTTSCPGIDTAAILIRSGDRLITEAATGLETPAGVPPYAVRWGEGFAGWIAAHRAPLSAREAAQDPRVRNPAVRRAGVRALVGVPLIFQDEVLGVAHVGSLTRPEIAREELQLFHAMVERAAQGIGLHLLRERAEASAAALALRVRQQAAVSALGRAVLARRPVAEVLEEAARRAAEALEGDLAYVTRLEPDGQAVRIVAGMGWAPDVVGTALLPVGTGSLAGYTLRARAPVVVGDYPHDGRFSPAPVLLHHGIVAGVTAVVERRGAAEPLGTVGVFARRPRAWVEADQHFVQAIANAVADALEHDRLDQEARRELQLREDVLGVVSHDLRGPLGVIRIGLAVVARSLSGQAAADARRSFAAVERAVGRMERLIRDLLDMARIRAGRVVVARRPEDLAALVEEAVAGLVAAAQEKGVALHGAAPGGVTLACDRDRMLQVLDNLLANAVRFTPAGGRVALDAGAGPEGVWLTVTDTGPGIPAADLPLIFEPYWSRPGRTAGQGTGLGLYITRALVEAHGGTIRAEAAPGGGARFTLQLPTAGPPREAPPPAPDAAPAR
ncbi:MAG: GAF domain-containing protein [Anaeromyxobacter sp.]